MSNIRSFSRSFANLANFADLWTREKMKKEERGGKCKKEAGKEGLLVSREHL
jgi:hypothetical protein